MFEESLRAARIIPVLAIENTADAVPLARALVQGGLTVLEVTLRTPQAADAIRAINDEVPEAVVGAGTLLKPSDFEVAVRAGAKFLVSPGLRPELLARGRDSGPPYLPGVMTPSEVMTARESGLTLLKFFPCEPAGGPSMLRQLHGPFPDIRFCPTGGLKQQTLRAYLDCPNVICVGGMWVAPLDRIAAKDWDGITELARAGAEAAR